MIAFSGLSDSPFRNQGHAAARTVDKRKAIPLTFSTYGLPKHPLNEAIEVIGDCGYDGLEICVAPTALAAASKLSPGQRREARLRMKDRDLLLGSLMSHLRPLGTAEQHAADLERLKQDCILAHDLAPDSPPIIQTVLGGSNWEQSRQLCVERIADWVEIANRYEVTLAVKPHRGHALSRPSEAAWLIKQLNQPPRIRMWYDYSHFIFREMPMRQTITESLPIVAGVAVKDAVRKDGKIQFLLPGAAGTINYQQLFRILSEEQFTGPLCVEVSSHVWKAEDYDADTALRDSYRVLSAAMGRSTQSDS